jgi:hypothetical protein
MDYQKHASLLWSFTSNNKGIAKPYDIWLYFLILHTCVNNKSNNCRLQAIDICNIAGNSSRNQINLSLILLNTLGFINLVTNINRNNNFYDIVVPSNQTINLDKCILFTRVSVTYLAYNPDNGLYKIGATQNIMQRSKALKKYGKKVKIFLWMEGGYSKENELHRYFSDKRVSGEWFSLNNLDIAYIKASNPTKEIL